MSALRAAEQSWRSNLGRWLTEPFSPGKVSDERRHTARLLAGLLLAVFVATVISIVYSLLVGEVSIAMSVTCVIVAIAYVLSRTRHYPLAAVLTLAILAVPSLTLTLGEPDLSEAAVRGHLVWLILPVLLGSVLYSVRGTILVALASFAVMLALPLLKPELHFRAMGGALGLLFTTSAVLVIFVYHRNRLEQHRRAELVESEARYRSLFQDSSISLWEEDFSEVKAYLDDLRHSGISDLEAYLKEHPEIVRRCAALVRILSVNQVTLDLLEAESEKALLQGLGMVFTQESFDVFRQELVALIQGNTRFSCETVHRTLTGNSVRVALSIAVAPGHEDSWSKVFVSLVDISERRRAEKALRESEEQFRSVFENAVMGLYRTTPDGQVLMANPALLRIAGYSSFEELAAINLENRGYPPGHSRAAFRQQIEATGQIMGLEFAWQRSDGSIAFVRENARAIRDQEGNTLYYEGTIEDITERKRAEDELRRNEQRYRALFERTNDAVFILDLEGVHLAANQQAADMLGYTADELVGLSFRQLVAPQQLPASQEKFDSILAGESPPIYERTFIRKDGTEVLTEINTALVCDPDGQPLHIQSIVRDITRRKRAEQLLLELNELALTLMQALTPREVFTAVGDALGGPCFFCCIFLIDKSQSNLFVKYVSSETDTIRDLEKATGSKIEDLAWPIAGIPFFREAIYERKTVLVQDARQLSRHLPPGLGRQVLEKLRIPNFICAPLIVEDEVHGMLWVQSPNPTEDDIPVVTAFAHQVAAAWRKAELYQQAQQEIAERKRAETEREHLLADLIRRSKQLMAAAEVSKSASTILDPDELMDETVNLIQQGFDFYYVGLFLVDQAGEYAVLHAGTGEAGRKMLAAGHKLAVGGESMIGQSVAHAEARIALDVGEEAARFDNPHLPETRSEMALPLVSRGLCSGALTVQSTTEAAFSSDDIAVLQSMADQLAVALSNARLYDEVQRYATHLEDLVAERTAELSAVNRELEAFAYSVSHDLRAPLRSVDGFGQALLEDYGDRLDAAGQDYIRRMRAASQRMGQLIDDILSLSRLARRELHREAVDLSRLAQAVAAELQAQAPQRQIEFVMAQGVVAHGDEHLLRAVLENLLGNAWKFTSKQARARIEFGVTEHDGKMAYFVRDDGAGFDAAYAHKLFAPFQRLHGMTEYEGSGVGLASVQRIIHRHGGQVWAEGAEGQGATFYFTLPTKGEVQ